ncbi:MAG: hypothetical protein LBJ10_03050 [Clostridiales bacterium]|jgi:hypothetical protein|nr:hypothetical protein [Clostridiales bacterium]
MNHGFAGSYARQPDMIVATRPSGDAKPIKFGSPLMRGPGGSVVAATGALTAETFAGVAGKEFKSALAYLEQSGAGGEYAPGEAVPVFQRGSINVLCALGGAALGGAAYVRTAADGVKKVGDFEAAADAGKNVPLPNAQWGGDADPNGVAELVLLTRANA